MQQCSREGSSTDYRHGGFHLFIIITITPMSFHFTLSRDFLSSFLLRHHFHYHRHVSKMAGGE
jgi:hypothetical protein